MYNFYTPLSLPLGLRRLMFGDLVALAYLIFLGLRVSSVKPLRSVISRFMNISVPFYLYF